jgi:hypothetical protein
MITKDKETNQVILILLLAAFAFGFLVAEGIYNNTPITRADVYEINQPQYYE